MSYKWMGLMSQYVCHLRFIFNWYTSKNITLPVISLYFGLSLLSYHRANRQPKSRCQFVILVEIVCCIKLIFTSTPQVRRGKRRRTESKRYSGFVRGTLHRSVKSGDLLPDPTLFCPTPVQTVLSEPPSLSVPHDLSEAVLSKPAVLCAKVFPSLTYYKMETLESQESNPIHCAHLLQETKLRKECTRDISSTRETNFNVCNNDNSPLNGKKLLRKHAICAIFDKIWGPKNSNGFVEDGIREEGLLVKDRTANKEDLFETFSVSKACVDPEQMSPNKREKDPGRKCHYSPLSTDNPTTVERPCVSRESDWLREAQHRCRTRSQCCMLQLRVRKGRMARRSSHRKKRKLRWTRRRRKTTAAIVPEGDADDEDSDGNTNQVEPAEPLGGPLKDMALSDLWIQKEFYLRHLCNRYKLPSEGCKPWLISRLHQFILQSTESAPLSKPINLKQRTMFRRSEVFKSWVTLNVEYKARHLIS